MTTFSILVVDDESSIVASLARDLECRNYLVGKAVNGEEALLMLRTLSYDLVITDLVMPRVNGLEVLKRAKETSAHTGVFILTGYGDISSAIDALRLGADDYLLKPCDPDELLLRVERFMDKLQALRTLKKYEDILPICTFCKKIRDDANIVAGTGQWVSIEEFLFLKSGLRTSHGCCPECYEKHKDD